MKENQEIKKANDEYEYLTGEEAERRIAFLRDKAIRDEKSMRQGARDEGREEGREEGERKKQIEIAKKMLTMKMSIEQIAEATGLDKEKIEELMKKS